MDIFNVVVVDTGNLDDNKHYKVRIENGKNNNYNNFIYADKKTSLTSFYISKNPYFKDPMRFGIWTFLDILKMSIF